MHYTASVWMNIIFGVLDVVVIVLSWGPITKFYNKKVAENTALANITYDNYGCD
jgi:hypothetical protein